MVVIVHQTVSKDFNAPELMGLGKRFKKRLVVLFMQKCLLTGAAKDLTPLDPFTPLQDPFMTPLLGLQLDESLCATLQQHEPN